MDLLKRELQRKREALRSDFGGRKLLKTSEIEQKRLQKARDQELLHPVSRSAPPLPSSAAATSSSASTAPSSTSLSDPSHPSSSSSDAPSVPLDADERRIDELVLPRAEVIRRLRLLKHPVTLFGEDDDARLARFKSALKSAVVDADLDMTEGQTNDFLRDIYDMRRRRPNFNKPPSRQEVGGEGDDDDDFDGDGGKGGDGDGGSSGADKDQDVKRMGANFEDLCDEDKILVFFKRLLNEWSQELEEMPEADKRTARGKSMVATFKQCARYLNPLFKFCRKKVLPDDIRQALLVVVQCCMKRDYLAAMDQYIKLAIGNAPWPIGVTMVGIHERSAREKIYTNSVAHIMNDETTRKYLQSVKRLMTLAQRRYPADPSKSVEFNSLANGSDLQSLLEEKRGRSCTPEERLMLTAPQKKD